MHTYCLIISLSLLIHAYKLWWPPCLCWYFHSKFSDFQSCFSALSPIHNECVGDVLVGYKQYFKLQWQWFYNSSTVVNKIIGRHSSTQHVLVHKIPSKNNGYFCLPVKVVAVVFFIIGIQPLGRSGQRPEFSQAKLWYAASWASS